ncbi:hypothetical protein IWX48DRAFT_220770, partial [Phyllosticta citricarpa]
PSIPPAFLPFLLPRHDSSNPKRRHHQHHGRRTEGGKKKKKREKRNAVAVVARIQIHGRFRICRSASVGQASWSRAIFGPTWHVHEQQDEHPCGSQQRRFDGRRATGDVVQAAAWLPVGGLWTSVDQWRRPSEMERESSTATGPKRLHVAMPAHTEPDMRCSSRQAGGRQEADMEAAGRQGQQMAFGSRSWTSSSQEEKFTGSPPTLGTRPQPWHGTADRDGPSLHYISRVPCTRLDRCDVRRSSRSFAD